MSGIERLNALSLDDARSAFERCCGASRWVTAMLSYRPFHSDASLFETARNVWHGLGRDEWLEAFQQHPRIGDVKALREKYAATRAWASGEQAGAQAASEDTLVALSDGNREYEARFGYIFIVCATGKSAGEMLTILRSRLPNDPEAEIHVAAREQEKITQLRLEKLLAS